MNKFASIKFYTTFVSCKQYNTKITLSKRITETLTAPLLNLCSILQKTVYSTMLITMVSNTNMPATVGGHPQSKRLKLKLTKYLTKKMETKLNCNWGGYRKYTSKDFDTIDEFINFFLFWNDHGNTTDNK